MPNTKRLPIEVPATWGDEIDTMLHEGESRSVFVRDALVAHAAARGRTLTAAPRPHGYRLDQRPPGWRSLLYRDRYQLVAVWQGHEFVLYHQHEYADALPPNVLLLRADEVFLGDGLAVEVAVVAPPDMLGQPALLSAEVKLAVQEWLLDNAL